VESAVFTSILIKQNKQTSKTLTLTLSI